MKAVPLTIRTGCDNEIELALHQRAALERIVRSGTEYRCSMVFHCQCQTVRLRAANPSGHRRSSRNLRIVEALAPFERNEPCWCGSGLNYKRCHGLDRRSRPGDPVPPETEDGFWLAPHTKMARTALDRALPEGGAPILVHGNRPTQRPLWVPPRAEDLATSTSMGSLDSLEVAGQRRFELLADYGLDQASTVDAQLAALPDSAVDDLSNELLNLAREVVVLVSHVQRRDASLLWVDASSIPSIVGETMLWADHYAIEDGLLDQILQQRTRPEDLGNQIRRQLELRPLIEIGVVVPVPVDVATTLVRERIWQTTEVDLSNTALLRWLRTQVLLEGPTAREVIFASAKDDGDPSQPYFYGRVTGAEDNGHFTTKSLGHFDADFDYGPWIETVHKQFAGRVVQQLNTDLAIGEMSGGSYLTKYPFRARLLRQKGIAAGLASSIAEVDVPWFPEADVATLARIAKEDEAVADLRAALARATRRVSDGQDRKNNIQDLVDDLAHDASTALDRRLRRNRLWGAVIPVAALGGTVALGATAGPVGLGGALLAAVASLTPLYSTTQDAHAQAAYTFWLARRRSQRQQRRRN
jgi:hypothetical protein